MKEEKFDVSRYRAQAKPLHGFTLIELLITIVIAAVLLAAALPSFNDTLARNRLAAQQNELIAALATARAESIRRNSTVALCAADAAQASCVAAWSRDWLVWDDLDADGTVDAGEEIIQVGGAGSTEVFSAPSAATHTVIRFNRRGIRELPAAAAVSLQISATACTTGKPYRRTIAIFPTGATRATTTNC